MVRLISMAILLAMTVPSSLLAMQQDSGAALGADNSYRGPKTVVLTKADYGRTINVSKGDVVILELPASMPMGWAQEKDFGFMREVKVPPKPEKPDPAQPQGDKPPPLGKSRPWVRRYEVVSNESATFTPEWMYCMLGRWALTKKKLDGGTIVAPRQFQPDMNVEGMKEGTIFRISLKIAPRG